MVKKIRADEGPLTAAEVVERVRSHTERSLAVALVERYADQRCAQLRERLSHYERTAEIAHQHREIIPEGGAGGTFW